jgi:hypothetical protein
LVFAVCQHCPSYFHTACFSSSSSRWAKVPVWSHAIASAATLLGLCAVRMSAQDFHFHRRLAGLGTGQILISLLFFSHSRLSGLARFPILLVLDCSPVFLYRCVCTVWLNSQLVLKQNASTIFCSCLVRSGPYFLLTTGLCPRPCQSTCSGFPFAATSFHGANAPADLRARSHRLVKLSYSCAPSGPRLVTSCSVLVSPALVGAPATAVRELLLPP